MIKRRNIKAFTLVEMLIVVVIIGILASALIPRLTWAQARARDAARHGHLNQLVTALSTYYNDEGEYPGWKCVNDLQGVLVPQYLKSIPGDPQKNRITYWTKDGWCKWYYAYTAMYRNGAWSWGMVILANTETEKKNSNWVLDDDADGTKKYKAVHFYNDWSTENIANGVFTNADEAEKYLCTPKGWVTLGHSKNELIDSSNKLFCKAKDNPAMVYVIFQ